MQQGTYLEPAFSFTVSLTASIADLPELAGAASFLPPVERTPRPTAVARVPRARYSLLMALPRITLKSP